MYVSILRICACDVHVGSHAHGKLWVCSDRFMKNQYTPFLLSAKGKILVLLGSAGLLAAGIYGITQVKGRGTAYIFDQSQSEIYYVYIQLSI